MSTTCSSTNEVWFCGGNSDLVGQGSCSSSHCPLLGLNISLISPTHSGTLASSRRRCHGVSLEIVVSGVVWRVLYLHFHFLYQKIKLNNAVVYEVRYTSKVKVGVTESNIIIIIRKLEVENLYKFNALIKEYYCNNRVLKCVREVVALLNPTRSIPGIFAKWNLH